MDSIDLSRGQQATLQDAVVLDSLPPEIIEIIRLRGSSDFLDAIATASLVPALTLKFFVRFENVFADTCARWISGSRYEKEEVVEAFARILRFAPYLSVNLEKYLRPPPKPPRDNERVSQDIILQYLSGDSQDEIFDLSELRLQRFLLAALRLLIFDKRTFARTISPSKMQMLLQHSNRPVRYLAVKILCHLLSASDVKLEEMLSSHIGKEEAVMGDFDGLSIDYGFLSLYEEKSEKNAEDMRMSLQQFTPHFGDILVPRPEGRPAKHSPLVRTVTTSKNMRVFAEALLSNSPILVHGLSGSGKTSLVNDFARELGKISKMVTLHLNEQTDAKMLIGMYTTDSTPGTFKWRPGVLTTAIREGRWVFIEDLDRAPNEVLSVILPLIERGELLVPSRAENVIAAPGFRLIASIRTSLNMSGHEIAPALHMLGARLWNRVPMEMPSRDEFMEIINGTHPILHKFLPSILAVYERLYLLSQTPSFASKSRTSAGRPISPRDLLKWCRRLDTILVAAGSKTGDEPISDTTKDEMFMEGADCFASSLQTEESRKSIIFCIAEEMHIAPLRVEHYVEAHIPRYEEDDTHLRVGRVKIPKRNKLSHVTRPASCARPFANTAHAKKLLEQVGVALKMAEPVLLVGETGVGKTTVIQQLADSLGYKLTVVNLSQQSEAGDLLGGFKPVNIRSLAIPLKEEFDDLFSLTGISATRNQKYLEQLGKSIAKGQWSKASKLWHEAPRMFDKILSELSSSDATRPRDGSEQPSKRRKTDSRLQALLELKPRWERFSRSLDLFDVQLSGGSKGFAFTFVEGNIIKAVRNGDWVLLDEINLASPDTLESIADLLHSGPGGSPSILLSETGAIERVRAHPDFRIFGAMNPATDVGKRDLPIGLRSRFTEIYIESPDRDLDDLLPVINAYFKGTTTKDERAARDVARLYMNTKRLADEKCLVDGANQIPHFSLRTLTRVLTYATEIAPSYGLRRALFEGYAMGFLTLLNGESERMLMPLINHYLLDSHSNPQSLMSQAPRHPEDGREYVRFMNKKRDRQYWMLQGSETPHEQSHYIITPSVERNVLNLVRATSTRRFPVLVQGPTSSGKTSMIEYLAKFSGNKFVRINNHEHTDLQEYLGSYISGADGQLRFQEGLLVRALREGHWIVLDELNLAPSDVLEALNRLLDDNRELLIPETQEVVRPHENFMLFATQNPPGLYGGRKTLSRAFRNRFLELHFDDIPEDELEYILEKRNLNVAPSDCKRIVTVYKELSRLRQSNRLFEKKDSFATLRDLFRWASRNADNREQLAANGYMLLAERVRKPDEKNAVKEVIERVMKVKLDLNMQYDAASSPEIQLYNSTVNSYGIVWNNAIRRLYVLVAHALRNNEPVLLVGETGCGKTTVCQMLAEAFGKELHIVNAHQNTETGDLIGAQRPVRNRAAITKQLEDDLAAVLQGQNGPENSSPRDLESLLAAYNDLPDEARADISDDLHQCIKTGLSRSKALFEWTDGSLVHAMKEGQFFLLDEISLADDSVLERLNSALESERTLLLAEKGAEDSFVQAVDGFQFFATMNPGGDYGKRELSPALRNRFTEIWVPSLSEHEDVLQIVEAKLCATMKHFAKAIVEFAEWFGHTYRSSATQSISVRDVLAWIRFVNSNSNLEPYSAVIHGAAMIYIDTLGANPAALLAIDPNTIIEERQKCLRHLSTLLDYDVSVIYGAPVMIKETDQNLTFGNFAIGKFSVADTVSTFAFQAPTTKLNAMRVVRALQVQKPILIEGSPGVGKTTLITALAGAIGKPLTRINLSEQTDLMDLFGSDVPVEAEEAGSFAWRDAPFLRAMQNGEWVLLDEMNLASQSVLEGLNACLDHRGAVYISELDQTFKRHPDFCVFAAQNPHHQGGGRKGLPSSFVNRFTVVYADVFRNDDLILICKHNFPAISDEVLSKIIGFVSALEREVVHRRRFGSQGGPWEFNLRDSLRWLQLLSSFEPFLVASHPTDFLDILFRQRFRTIKDRQEVDKIFMQVFMQDIPFRHYFHNLSADGYQVGIAYLSRDTLAQRSTFPLIDMKSRLPELESIMMCIGQALPCILVGPSGSGKTTMLQHLAAASGTELTVFALNTDIDTMDLVGGYEQMDPRRASSMFVKQLCTFLETRVLSSLPKTVPAEAIEILSLCQNAYTDSKQFFAYLYEHLLTLQSKTSLSEINSYVTSCRDFMHHQDSIQTARFEWVDGLLIKALNEGKWLVLDNANLCSSSVLDRLNSLLEPNGVLNINEHCGPGGETNVVKPHPNFRLFMTMDPRFGELSRAMRNRAVEIYIDNNTNHISTRSSGLTGAPHVEASLLRYRNVVSVLQAPFPVNWAGLLAGVALDHLSRSDVYLLERFARAVPNGLVNPISPEVFRVFRRYLQIMESKEYKGFRDTVQHKYGLFTEKMHFLDNLKDAQPIHPLENSTLVPMFDHFGWGQSYWLGAVLDFLLEIHSAYDAKQSQATALSALKPSQMNRLQRSMCRDRIPSAAKDSTVGVAMFLVDTLNALQQHLRDNVSESGSFKNQKNVIGSIIQLWWETYQLTSSKIFEDAVFQAHLAIARDILTRESSRMVESNNHSARSQEVSQRQIQSRRIIDVVQSMLRYYFEDGFALTTGLSMEKLWRLFRPKPISTIGNLKTLIDMEELATRYDRLKWKASISVPELSTIMSSLVDAYSLILTSEVDGRSLVQTLTAEIAKLEKETVTEDTKVSPFFSDQFEALRQYDVLQQTGNATKEVIALSNISTSNIMHTNSASDSSIHLQKIGYLWGKEESIFPIKNSFLANLLHKLHRVGDVDLRMLGLLETELPILGECIAQGSASMCRDQLLDLNMNLHGITITIIGVHGQSLTEEVEQWTQRLSIAIKDDMVKDFDYSIHLQEYIGFDANSPIHFLQTFKNHLGPALIAIAAARNRSENQLKHSSLAWVHFAIGCITLYVPDRSFDPNSKQQLERQQYGHIKERLENKISALRIFENVFTGQNSSLRCQILEDELHELEGPALPKQEVIRPEVSELDQLQGEFNNLLGTVLRAKPLDLVISHFVSAHNETSQGIKLLQKNLAQIIHRLSERFRAYGDITVPVVGMLQCLQIGLHMATLTSADVPQNNSAIVAISDITPFLGGTPLQVKPSMLEYPLDILVNIAMVAGVEGIEAISADQRQLFLDVFHSCYEKWSTKLEADRKEAESRTGLYRFRGSAEDEEEVDQEEFNELFPAYENETAEATNNTTTALSARDITVALAKAHAKIVSSESNPTERIMSTIREMSERIGTLYKDNAPFASGIMTRNLLPGALLKLSDQMEALQSSATTDSYNFYIDANLPESRKLVILIQQIQNRFRDLQNVDEISHMQPLEDVMVSCKDLLRFRHTEPLGKIITKVEKVHNFMHEWQFGGWASRANSALTLYNNLTSTIVSWRRLELTTWARLFDMEDKKCDDDARSWWFVAYEVVIAAPLSMSQSEPELRNYTQKLLQNLETYFATSIQGQFRQRLQLLKQHQKHLEILVKEAPLMSIILKAIENFTDIYSRYEKPVIENLQKGRLVLEKAMRDVLLLASWKDTNIVALRDSAKRSHHKLFKLVRKYRALLGQPMEHIIDQGLPDENQDASSSAAFNSQKILPSVDKDALALCAAHVPHWSEKSKRLVNVSKTVTLMDDTVQMPTAAVDGTEYLKSFLNNIISSTAELQKATPSILTDDNRTTVKHLKSRKRKLFADTLRELRQMGIKHNLGTTALSQQDSLFMILSNAENLSSTKSGAFGDFEYYYHKTIDLLPRARLATRQYSDDLSGAEVTRSIGLLEGLLQIVLKQRNAISAAMADSEKLEQALQKVKALWAPGKYDIVSPKTMSNHGSTLKWLPKILRVGSELVRVHSRLGNVDSISVLEVLSSYISTFDVLGREWQTLPPLPQEIDSTARENLKEKTADAIQSLCTDLADMSLKQPSVDFILQQIRPWAAIESEPAPTFSKNGDISIVDHELSKTCDSILVSIKKFSASIANVPTSTEDPFWLTKNDSCLLNGIVSLHISKITVRINRSFELLQNLALDRSLVGRLAGAIFAVALPIFQKYFNIVQQYVTHYANLHRATCKTTYILAKTFIQIASQGFCTPSEKSDPQDGKTDKLDGGTGLGDGEGAEDISKDIQDDEDMSELAQEPNKGEQGIDDERDAVDMADGDMEGEMGEAEETDEDEKGSGDGESDREDIDEEAGDVDDLDPNAVDEKMWDGEGEKAEKDQEGDQSNGKTNKDEQIAAQENDKKNPKSEETEDEEEELGAEQREELKQDELEKHDPHAQQGQTLELPDEMELDGNEQEGSASGSDDGMDNLSDINDAKDGEEEMDERHQNISEGEDADAQEDQETLSELDMVDVDNSEDNGGKETEEAGEMTDEPEAEDKEGLLRDHSDDAKADPNDAFPSEVQGTGEDQDENRADDKSGSESKAQRKDGGEGGKSSEQHEDAANEGDAGKKSSGEAPQDPNDETQSIADAQPFKRLGDTLERWHRQQRKIRDAPENKQEAREQPMEVNMDNAEFQHLQEDAQADTQALGTATEDQAHAVDESMAVDTETKDLPDTFQLDEDDHESVKNDGAMDVEDLGEQKQEKSSDSYDGRAGAMIRQAKPDRNQDSDDRQAQSTADVEEDIEEVDIQLSSTHIDDLNTFAISRSSSDARQLWTYYESQTRDLSFSLTEQLRLILAPTQATKMRGDFRTGKRLNIKRIIPYIASQYKRDKIWMRRSVPSKRSYQIMLAVDDSKSMAESGSGALAFETLVMVSKSLSMLEVGEICVLGFGEDVKVAHDFETPFSNDAGPKVFQNFGFGQGRTDVTKLVKESIELFRAARAKASSSPADLWQLELIISDGVCDSSEHEPIRRLLREAIEERIMMVFVIVDDLKSKKSGESVMDLKEAKFIKDEETGQSNVKIERYLDTFPFQYYLIVSDVKELPGVLATLLRQWFAEVADSSG